MVKKLRYEEMEMSGAPNRRRRGPDRRRHEEAGGHRTFARPWGSPRHLPYVSVPDSEGNSPERNMIDTTDHVDKIVHTMEADEILMRDNPVSEGLRMEQLRCMPQALTMKRQIKAKLNKSVSKKSNRKPLSFTKQARYRLSMTFAKVITNKKPFIFPILILFVFYSFKWQ